MIGFIHVLKITTISSTKGFDEMGLRKRRIKVALQIFGISSLGGQCVICLDESLVEKRVFT